MEVDTYNLSVGPDVVTQFAEHSPDAVAEYTELPEFPDAEAEYVGLSYLCDCICSWFLGASLGFLDYCVSVMDK